MTNKLTKEEALKKVRGYLTDYLPLEDADEIDEIIEALEPSITPSYNSIKTELKPCEDCISREEAINEADNLSLETSYDNEKVEQMLRDLPSVKPQRKKGKWIKIQSGNEDFPESIVCSRCKNENSHLDFDEHSEPIGKVFVTSKYCPNCGSYNADIKESDKE